MVLDRLDSVVFPRSGWGIRANIFDSNSMLGADDTYTRWNAEGSVVYSIGNHTLNFNLTAGGGIGNDPLPTYDLFAWGGFLRQSGYATGQLLGQNLTFGRVMYYNRIFHGTLFEGAYGGLSLELGKVGDPLVAGNPDGWLKSGSLFVGMDSPLGPAYLAYGRARDGNDAVYFFLGRPY
jgi:NTE family protein